LWLHKVADLSRLEIWIGFVLLGLWGFLIAVSRLEVVVAGVSKGSVEILQSGHPGRMPSG
jgi:hypothetical protein